MIAMRQMSGIDDNVKDTVNNHDKRDANDEASSFRTRGGSLSGPALADVTGCFGRKRHPEIKYHFFDHYRPLS